MSQAIKQCTLREIADFLSAKLQGDENCVITGIAPINKAVEGQISFLEQANYRPYLETTKASAIILAPAFANQTNANVLILDSPYVGYARVSSLFTNYPEVEIGINPRAVVGLECHIGQSARIAANCVIGNRVTIGENVQIDPGCVIGDDVSIGDNSKLYANVTIYHGVKIGKNNIIHGGVVIGADGFGMANDRGRWVKIHQLGSVHIGDDVEIGANTTIDRGALENTIIEDGVKLDNQIQIGHNVRVGAYTIIAGCVGIAGSTKIGKHCMIGGGVGLNGHITIADGTIITARSAVHKSITEAGIYASGIPAMPHKKWWRVLKRMSQLEEIIERIHKLEHKNERECDKRSN